MSQNKIDRLLLDLKARQDAGEHMPCPRCGLDTMQYPPVRNALSRLADVYVCPVCGTDEAKLAYMRAPGSLYKWVAFQPVRPESDYKERSGEEVWNLIQEQSAEKMLGLYKAYVGKELESSEVRFRAFESIPGLNQIWTEPFMMRFDCKEGNLMVQFRETEESTTMTGALVSE